MKKPSQNRSLQEQIVNQLEGRETEDLVAIWQENDREAWTDDAFKAIEGILFERLGELPEQKAPDSIDEHRDTSVEYPTDRKLIWIADLSNKLSWVVLAVAVVFALLKLILYFLIQPSPTSLGDLAIWNAVITILTQVETIIYAGFTFLVLQAVTEVIYLLMDLREMIQSDVTVDD